MKLYGKHSGKFIANLTNDVAMITIWWYRNTKLIKRYFNINSLLSVMFYQNWKLSLIAIIMTILASYAKSLGKRIGKVTMHK